MVSIDQLKKIQFLQDLPDEILEKIHPHARQTVFEPDTILIRQNETQHLVHMLVSGKICLNARSDTGRVLTLDEIMPGQSFGLSAFFGKFPATFTAICTETCDVIVLSGDLMYKLFEVDYGIGYVMMRRVAQLFKGRMNRHTGQFLHSLSIHPAIISHSVSAG
ncbi:MAG: Crp/Fnr family transcriptional regulator [Desulfotignum sp.]|nr:Crp/Fnr family transcriptional regulator [Desulfotignum sp.]